MLETFIYLELLNILQESFILNWFLKNILSLDVSQEGKKLTLIPVFNDMNTIYCLKVI